MTSSTNMLGALCGFCSPCEAPGPLSGAPTFRPGHPLYNSTIDGAVPMIVTSDGDLCLTKLSSVGPVLALSDRNKPSPPDSPTKPLLKLQQAPRQMKKTKPVFVTPDGAIVTSEGTVVHSDGTLVRTDGSLVPLEGKQLISQHERNNNYLEEDYISSLPCDLIASNCDNLNNNFNYNEITSIPNIVTSSYDVPCLYPPGNGCQHWDELTAALHWSNKPNYLGSSECTYDNLESVYDEFERPHQLVGEGRDHAHDDNGVRYF